MAKNEAAIKGGYAIIGGLWIMAVAAYCLIFPLYLIGLSMMVWSYY